MYVTREVVNITSWVKTSHSFIEMSLFHKPVHFFNPIMLEIDLLLCLQEPVHQTMVSGPSSGFRTAADFRTTTTTVSGLNVNNLFRPYTAASVDMLNR